MKFTIQQRTLANGTKSLVLAYNKGNKRCYEFLKLYLIPEKTRTDKQLNISTLELAEKIRAKRIISSQNQAFGFSSNINYKKSFITYFTDQTEARFNENKNYFTWRSTLKHLKLFTKGYLPMDMITEQWMLQFRSYLEKNLSPNSSNSYFNVVKHGIHDAIREGYVMSEAATRVKATPGEESNKIFLTIDEIRILAKSECKDDRLKKAFLFSCLSGLRISDIQRVQWNNLSKNDFGAYEITLTMKKTSRSITIPINQEAVGLLGTIKITDERIFSGIKYSAHLNNVLCQWVLINGIQKHITWHSARHTYACLLIAYGTDIYTVSKLLGHKDVRTTQVYAKVMDETKRNAINNLPSFGAA